MSREKVKPKSDERIIKCEKVVKRKKKWRKFVDSNNNDWFNCIQACMFLIYDMNGNNKILFICYTYFYTNIYICITHKSNIIYLYFKEMKEKGRRNRMIYLSNRMKTN